MPTTNTPGSADNLHPLFAEILAPLTPSEEIEEEIEAPTCSECGADAWEGDLCVDCLADPTVRMEREWDERGDAMLAEYEETRDAD